MCWILWNVNETKRQNPQLPFDTCDKFSNSVSYLCFWAAWAGVCVCVCLRVRGQVSLQLSQRRPNDFTSHRPPFKRNRGREREKWSDLGEGGNGRRKSQHFQSTNSIRFFSFGAELFFISEQPCVLMFCASIYHDATVECTLSYCHLSFPE